MNREDIIRMARDAGAIPIHKRPKELAVVGNENIERFFQSAYAAGAAAERDELQSLETDAHFIFNNPPSECSQEVRDVIEWYASSIRARGSKPD